MREIFPATEEVAESMDRNSVERLVRRALVRRGEHLGIDPIGAQPLEQLDEPRRDHVAVIAWKRCGDVEDSHGAKYIGAAMRNP